MSTKFLTDFTFFGSGTMFLSVVPAAGGGNELRGAGAGTSAQWAAAYCHNMVDVPDGELIVKMKLFRGGTSSTSSCMLIARATDTNNFYYAG